MSLKTSLVIDLAGNMQARARQYGQSLTNMGKVGQAAMRGLQASSVAMGRGLDSLGNRYTAALTGAGTAVAVKNVMNLQERMTRMGISAGATGDRMKKLHEKVTETANMPDIRVDPSQLYDALDSIVEKTGDLDFAEENLRTMGLAIQAAGVAGKDVGEILAEFQKQGMTKEQSFQALDTLINQGKMGAFVLKDLARLGPRVVTAYTALGHNGPQAMREMGAMLQVIKQGVGSSEEGATAFEALLATFKDKTKLDFFKKNKIQIFDPEQLKKGKHAYRPITDIVKDILKATGGRADLLSMAFDQTAIRAFNALASELTRTGGAESLKKFMEVSGDGTAIQEDAAIAAKTANAALQSLKNTWDGFADSQLAEPIQQAADALNRIGPEKMTETLNTAKNIALALGGVVLASKALGVAANVRSLFGKKGGAAGAGGIPGLGGIKLPLPVYVVNKQMSLTRDAMMGKGGKGGELDMGGMGGDAEAGKASGKGKARGGRAARLAGRAGGVASAGLAVYEAGRVVMDDEATLADKAEGVASAGGQALGGWGGAALGAKMGAAIGTVIAPGVGTAIGAALGSVGGGIAGALGAEWLVSAMSNFFKSDNPQTQMQPLTDQMRAMQDNFKGALYNSTIRIQVDGAATATVASNNGMGNLDVYSGTSFAAGLGD